MSGPFKMKGWSPFTFTQKEKTIRELQSEERNNPEYHSSGLPENLYDANGNAINTTTDIDEGQFSSIKGSGDNKYYEAIGDSDKYTKGEKFYINKPQ